MSTLIAITDNRVLAEVCGPGDLTLSKVEQLTGTVIVRVDQGLEVHGQEPDTEAFAGGVLTELKDRATIGKPLEPGDVDAVLRMQTSPEPVAPANQIEMFSGGAVEFRTRKKTVEPRTDAQKAYVRQLYEHEMVFGIGPAGTGKTYLAVAAAVNMYLEGSVDRIILTRPAVEAGERLGFLPGDMKEKVDPYLRPLYDALYDMIPAEKVERHLVSGAIEIAPLAFMRGRTLSNSAVILDEAQNTTSMQMKMFLTRLGEGSKMFVTGDPSQIDLPRGVPSGLVESLRVLRGVKGIKQIHFKAEDVVRHELVARIVNAYEDDTKHSARMDKRDRD